MSIDFSQEEAQTTPLMTTSLLGEDEGEGSLRPKRLTEYIGPGTGQNHAVGDHRQRNGGPYPHYLRPGH